VGRGAECAFGRSWWTGRGHGRTNSGTGYRDLTNRVGGTSNRNLDTPANRDLDTTADRNRDTTRRKRYAWFLVHCSRFEFNQPCDSGQQHATVYGKSKYFQHSRNYPQRLAVRNFTRYGGDTELVDSEHGIVGLRVI